MLDSIATLSIWSCLIFGALAVVFCCIRESKMFDEKYDLMLIDALLFLWAAAIASLGIFISVSFWLGVSVALFGI